jgi:hypothetical protein
VADADDEDEKYIVFDVVDDAIIALADAIRALRRIGQRFDPVRARVICQRLSARNDSRSNGLWQFADLSVSGRGEPYVVWHLQAVLRLHLR